MFDDRRAVVAHRFELQRVRADRGDDRHGNAERLPGVGERLAVIPCRGGYDSGFRGRIAAQEVQPTSNLEGSGR